MDLHQLRCFVAVAEELHFGRAARKLDMMPSALGRHIRLLEESLDARLLARTTRNVLLTEEGGELLGEARDLLAKADGMAQRMRDNSRLRAQRLRFGTIDTAAAGLLPAVIHDFREARPDVAVQLIEDKSIRLLPRILSGRLDLALVRPPDYRDKRIEFLMLLYENPVVAVPSGHALASRRRLTVAALADQPLIVPDRRSRPHSHDLTMKLFNAAGLKPNIVQVAEEKQTIVNLVAADLGLAIVPRWISRLAMPGVRFVRLATAPARELEILPLAAAWLKGSRDPVRDDMLNLLSANLDEYGASA